MAYKQGNNQLRCKIDIDSKLNAMTSVGPQNQTFYPETVQAVYGEAETTLFEFRGASYLRATRIHPFFRTQLPYIAYLCPYCIVTNNLNFYFNKINTNIDHQMPFSRLKSGAQHGFKFYFKTAGEYTTGTRSERTQKKRKTEVATTALHLLNPNSAKVRDVEIDFTNNRHLQLLYNDLENLEVTCHGHNRIKGAQLAREGAMAAATLISINRANWP